MAVLGNPPRALIDVTEEVSRGLLKKRKAISPKFLYDAEGCRLFEQICALPEYYLTRTELAILGRHAGEMARELGPSCCLIEFGSGSGEKTRLLLERMEGDVLYVPMDIAREALVEAGSRFPGVRVAPVWGDFTRLAEFPRDLLEAWPARAVFFPGSTIGNLAPGAARRLLSQTAALLGPGGKMLVGIDLRKDPAVLEAAYNDSAGITAKFNLNLLNRLKIPKKNFRHRAFFNPRASRVEMHLVSRIAHSVRVGGRLVSFRAGESIHTESCYKHTHAAFARLARSAGFRAARSWTDPRGLFAVYLLTALRA